MFPGWWLTYPSEKWWSSSVGIIIPNTWKTKKMFQTTNQFLKALTFLAVEKDIKRSKRQRDVWRQTNFELWSWFELHFGAITLWGWVSSMKPATMVACLCFWEVFHNKWSQHLPIKWTMSVPYTFIYHHKVKWSAIQTAREKNKLMFYHQFQTQKMIFWRKKHREKKELRLLAAKLPPFPNSMDSIPVLLVVLWIP